MIDSTPNPVIRRDGDSWSLAWSGHGVAMGMERLQDTRDGLRAEVTVESTTAGRVLGPAWLNILSDQSQSRFAGSCAKRVNGLNGDTWHALVVMACAIVAKQYRAPTPTIDLSTVDTSTEVEYLIPGLIPADETTVVYGDGECLAAGSVIQGPAGNERVEVLARRGLPVPVWTLAPSGKEWAWASAPWLKGHGTLLRFTLEGGRAITVARSHRFLTPQGWRFASEIGVGVSLAVSQPSPLPSIAGLDPRVSLLSAQHCSQTPEDCRGGCWPYCRRYGPQLHHQPDGALAFAPSQAGAPERSRGGSRRDARASSAERSHGSSFCRPSSCGYAPSLQPPSIEGLSGASLHAIRHFESSRSVRPFLPATDPQRLRYESHQCATPASHEQDHSSPRPSLPPLESLNYRTIVSISIVGEGDYYDLSVPGTENYLANGIWHHNSAKSLTVLRIAASVALGQPLPWDDRPTRMCPVLYLDWETNPRTVAGRLQRIALGMVSAVPTIHYRQCFRSLTDELSSIKEEISKKKIGLVVVDSIGFAASGALTEDDTARSAMNALRQMSPATRLVVAHISASAAKETQVASRPFGSTFFWNGMRSGLELRRAEEGTDPDNIELGLYHRKANDGEHHRPIGMSVLFDGRKGAVAFIPNDVNETPDLAARTPLSSRLRALLKSGARDTVELADLTEMPIDSVSRTLRRMSGIVRVSDGGGRGQSARWGIADE